MAEAIPLIRVVGQIDAIGGFKDYYTSAVVPLKK